MMKEERPLISTEKPASTIVDIPSSSFQKPPKRSFKAFKRPGFKKNEFNPKQIIKQMALVQAGYYLSWLPILLFFDILMGFDTSFILSQLWDPSFASGSDASSWFLSILCFIHSGTFGGYILLRVVERAKLCLDFTCTVQLFHLVFTILYSSFPASIFWWLGVLMKIIVMSLAGEYLCMQKEMEPIALSHPAHPSTTSLLKNETVEMQRLE